MKPILILFTFLTTILSAQEGFTISGTITDVLNGETIFGASIYFKDTAIGVTSNEYGFYSLTASEGNYILVVSYLGYADFSKEISLNTKWSLLRRNRNEWMSRFPK